MLAIDTINKRACHHKYIMQLTPAAIFVETRLIHFHRFFSIQTRYLIIRMRNSYTLNIEIESIV